MTCIHCDKDFTERQYNSYMKMCNKCAKVQRFSMEVEFDNPGLDYGVLIDDNLTRLLLQFLECKKTGWHISLGGCPNIKILSVRDNFKGEIVDPNKINKLMGVNYDKRA